jgi:predicted ATPase
MIYSLDFDIQKIKNHNIFHYVKDINIKTHYDFKPGINILIGENGSGKTTILNMLKCYTLTYKNVASEIDIHDKYLKLRLDKEVNINCGINVKADYRYTFFSLRQDDELDQGNWLNGMRNILQQYHSMKLSKGQKLMYAMQILFQRMFKDKESLVFPIEPIKEKCEFDKEQDQYNSYWRNLYSYYKNNNQEESNMICTMFMDEPDAGLDVSNLKEVAIICGQERKDVQVITSLHNQMLIYKLSKQPNINFIELTDNYLSSIKNFIEN